MRENEVNLHTHTFRCKHAEGTVKEYCREAVKAGLKVLGFAEHSPFPDERYGGTRMAYGELEAYRQEIEEAGALFPSLTLLAGLEVDLDPRYSLDFCQKELKERLDLDFLAAGAHFVHDASGNCIYAGANAHHKEEIVDLFAEKTVFLMKSGLFDFITHPDMVAGSIDQWNAAVEKSFRKIAECSAETGVALEINAYGLRKKEITYPDGTVRHPYPYEPFWKLFAGYGIPAAAGSDAHKPSHVYGNLPDVFSFASRLGIAVCNVCIAEKILKRRGKELKNG